MLDQELELHFSAIGEEFTCIRGDINLLKEDVAVLKEDVAVLKEDVAVLKEDVKNLEIKMDEGFKRQEGILKLILDIVKGYEVERKEIKSSLWDFDRRLLKLEKA